MKKKEIQPGEQRLVNWMFCRVIEWLNGSEREDDLTIFYFGSKKDKFFKPNLSNGGYFYPHIDYADEMRIYIHKLAIQPELVLLHEVLHGIYPEISGRAVYALERLIWNRLSEKQKEILRSFLPEKRKREL